MEGHEFYIVVNEKLDRILGNGVDMYKTDSNIWNGISPTKEVQLLMLGNEMSTKFSTNNLFTVPLNVNTFENLYLNDTNQLFNNIIINTPLDIKSVIINLPPKLEDFIGEKTLILGEGEKIDNIGVNKDEDMKPWYIGLSMIVPDIYFYNDEEINKLADLLIEVKCYTWVQKKEITID